MGSEPDAAVATQPIDREAWKRLTTSLPEPPRPGDRDDLLWQELAAQFSWYNRAATRTRLAYQILKMTTLVAGATVTVLAAISAPAAVTASVAGVIVVIEGAQQLFQFHPNWISYRSSAESLRQQAFLYVADVSPYDDPAVRRERLAAFLKSVTRAENTNWSNVMRSASPTGAG